MPYAIANVAVVRDADEPPDDEVVDAGLFLHFPEGGHLDVLAGLLVPFGKVPESVAADQQEVSPAVGNESARGIDLPEFCAHPAVGPFGVGGRHVDARQGFRGFKHPYERSDVHLRARMEFDGVGIAQCLVPFRTDDDAAFLEVDFVHGILKIHYICNLARKAERKYTIF